jgi:subtilisin-like proprotein convertase family protein
VLNLRFLSYTILVALLSLHGQLHAHYEHCNNNTITIPDQDANGATSTIEINNAGLISNISVTKLNLTHGNVGELILKLSNSKKTITLIETPDKTDTKPEGCVGKDFQATNLSDDGSESVQTACKAAQPAYGTAHFKPKDQLSAFIGDNAVDDWTLTVIDTNNYGAGELKEWCINYKIQSYATISPEPPYPTLNFGDGGIKYGERADAKITLTETTNNFALIIEKFEFTGSHNVDFSLTNPSASAFPITISAGQSQEFNIQCEPSAGGVRVATFTLYTNLPSPLSTLSYPLKCSAIAAAYNDGGINKTIKFDPVKPSETSAAKNISITNTGEVNLIIDSITKSGANKNEFNITGLPTIPHTIAKGDSGLNLGITCTPIQVSAPDDIKATLTIKTNSPGHETVNYALRCTGEGATYDSSPKPGDPVDFGKAAIEVKSVRNLSIANNGNLNLAISGVSFSGDGAAVFSLGISLPLTVEKGKDAILPVQCESDTKDKYEATITITHDAADSPTTYPLVCDVDDTTSPGYASTPSIGSTINFGNVDVNKSKQQDLILFETGTADLTIQEIEFSGSNIFSASKTAPFIIADGSPQQKLTLSCSPIFRGTQTATLNIKHNAVDSPANYTLTCKGRAPVYSDNLTGTLDLDTETVGTGISKDFTIKNTGELRLDLSGIEIQGDNADDFKVDKTSGFSINSNNEQKITITCTPKSIGRRVASLHFTSNDPAKTEITHNLECTGKRPLGAGYTSTPEIGEIKFGEVFVGETVKTKLVIAEVGTAVLRVSKGNPILDGSSDFSIISDLAVIFDENTGTSFVIPNGSGKKVELELACKPQAAGERKAHLYLLSNDVVFAKPSYKLTCTGVTPPAPPEISVVPTLPDNNIVQTDLPSNTTSQIVQLYDLTLNFSGDGSGAITGKLECHSKQKQCSNTYTDGSKITLQAQADADSIFVGWDRTMCNEFDLRQNTTCVAQFALLPPELPTELPTEPKPVAENLPETMPESVVENPPETVPEPVVENPSVSLDEIDKIDKIDEILEQPTTNAIIPEEIPCLVVSRVDYACNAEGEIVENLTILPLGSVSNMVVTGTVNNQGLIANTIVTSSGKIVGGVISGNIQVEAGGRLEDFEFRGNNITGATLSGNIINRSPVRGIIQDVNLMPDSNISGGYLAGKILGHTNDEQCQPKARLQDVVILAGSEIDQVIIGNGVKFAPGVKLGDCVVLAEGNVTLPADNLDSGVIYLAKNAYLNNSQLNGVYIGDPSGLALLEDIIVGKAAKIDTVIIGQNVQNQGLISNFELRGLELQGGIIGGKISVTRGGSFYDVQLAPNTYVNGGNFRGKITGSVAAPALLENSFITAATCIDNVVLGDGVIVARGACLGDNVTYASEQNDQNLAQQIDENIPMLEVKPSGWIKNSPAGFVPNIATCKTARPNRTFLSKRDAENLELKATIAVDAKHHGLAAELLLLAQHNFDAKLTQVMKIADGSWINWHEDMPVQGFKQISSLPEMIEIFVFKGDLGKVRGEINIFMGYRLADGTTVFNGGEPLQFFIDTTPESCIVYAVHDEGLNITQPLEIDLSKGLEGEMRLMGINRTFSGYDIEGLSLHPENPALLLASSGRNGNLNGDKEHRGSLYVIDKASGNIQRIGAIATADGIRFDKVSGIALNPSSNELWGWGMVYRGTPLIALIEIDYRTAEARIHKQFAALPENEMDDLAWGHDSRFVFLVTGDTLWRYDPEIQEKGILCDNISSQVVDFLQLRGEDEQVKTIGRRLGKIEAVDTQPNGWLLMGIDYQASTTSSIIAYDPRNCQVKQIKIFADSLFHDIEAIVWPSGLCNDQSWMSEAICH